MSANASSSAEAWEHRLFLAVVVLAPLPLGANRPWAWSLLALAVGALVLVRAARGGLRGVPPWLWAAGGLYLVAPLWAVVQALPGLPSSLAHPAWEAVAAPGAIAAVPEAALGGALRLLTYGGAFLLAFDLARRDGGPRLLARTLALAAGAYAAYGLVMLVTVDRVLWWEKEAYHGVFTATFVNRNSAAAFMGLGLLVAVTAALRAVRRGERGDAWRLGTVAGACGLALLLSLSRGGLAATAAGLIGLSAAVVWARRPPWRRLRRAVAGAGLAVVVLAALAGGGLFDRLGARGIAAPDRAQVWAATLQGIAERPWLGHGLGSFEAVFPAWRPDALRGHWDVAHATWLEMVLELGVPAAVGWHLSFAVVAAVCVGGLRLRRRRQEYPALGLGALVLAGGHGLVDFAFQMPANALWLAVILGLACAQSVPTRLANKPDSRAASDSAEGSPASARR